MSRYKFDPTPYLPQISAILTEVAQATVWNKQSLRNICRKYPKDGNAIFSKDQLVQGYRVLIEQQKQLDDHKIHTRLRMKPTRTISGVAPVTVLTKPFPCPGKCIYCPNDIRMPKSYLRDEPGAQRAERNAFDPYLQTYNRLLAFQNTGHVTDKVELIVLGGTWSFYPEFYQIWFIKRCFDALNDFGVHDRRGEVHTHNIFEGEQNNGGKKTYNDLVAEVVKKEGEKFFDKTERADWAELFAAQKQNEDAATRCVGMVIETRPDYLSPKEVIKTRKLGATKVQIGVQSLNDRIQVLNKRGHTSAQTAEAFKNLRMAGFKIHAHWMPGQYGATAQEDIEDYLKLWEGDYAPDELKIYPTSIIANTELNKLFEEGKYVPYTKDQLLEVLTATISATPKYCRLTRIIRDIPSTDIVAGNKLTNFRQIAEEELKKRKIVPCDIRSREIKAQNVEEHELEEEVIEYNTSVSSELFISYKTKADDKLVAFLRLSLHNANISQDNFVIELRGCAIIREVHVYGQVVGIGKSETGKSQHLGLGARLVARAEGIAKNANWSQIAVISAIGTRGYYSKLGYELDDLYMKKTLVL